jgi:carboxyl-terminal processing protease
MVSRLDENSAYINPQRSVHFNELIKGEFVGIGIEPALDPASGQLIVKNPMANSPAFRAGLQAQDKIVEVDGQSTSGWTLNDAVDHLRGPEGTAVVLAIEREGEGRLSVRIVRERILRESVLGDVRRPDGTWDFLLAGRPSIAYLRFEAFGEHTVEEFAQALERIKASKVQGLVLDLRENPGGVLDAAVGVAEAFLPRGTLIVSTRGRNGRTGERWQAEAQTPDLKLPLAVLVDRNSASASEIVAGCLQDHRRAVIIGERTYGKGTVQRAIKIAGGQSLLKLTTASYWRPSGRNIHRLKASGETDDWGIRPDKGFEVVQTDEQIQGWIDWRRQRDAVRPANSSLPTPAEEDDAMLRRAVEHLAANHEK